MRERIFGTECEYAPVVQSKKNHSKFRLLHGEALLDHIKGLSSRLFSTLALKGYPMAGEFMGNGGRLYVDRGGHPEYATPECRCVKDLVAYEKAGDRIMQELAAETNQQTAVGESAQTLHIFKNNVDFYGNTYGGHENYLITPRAAEGIGNIIPFLVTRQIFAGAGRILTCRESGTPAFQISQRAEFIDQTFSDRATRVRGIINTRKREIYAREQNRRLHLIVGDSNMSEFAIGLKIGTTALILRLLEEGESDGIPGLVSPVQTLKDISHHWNSRFQMAGRRGWYTALDVQSIYLDEVRRFFSSRAPTSDEADALGLWENILQGLSELQISGRNWQLEDDPGELRRKIDWIRKLWILNRYGNMDDPVVNDRRLKLMDLKYHDLNPATGLFGRCEALGLLDRMVEKGAIANARIRPPRNTRAQIRGTIIRGAADKSIRVEIEDWTKINIRAQIGQKSPGQGVHPFNRYKGTANCLTIRMEDPFKTMDSSIAEQIERFMETWE
ncbi:MAG: proteasome accessory factor PafA2 family protein [Deltaproteobacteria bacterium]|nr:proteasome accessory factor PafA2 family protein [Deltaproteobacteria bacterium]